MKREQLTNVTTESMKEWDVKAWQQQIKEEQPARDEFCDVLAEKARLSCIAICRFGWRGYRNLEGDVPGQLANRIIAMREMEERLYIASGLVIRSQQVTP